MAKLSQPYGITLPLMLGPLGYFAQSFNVIEQIKSNLIVLLQTKKGERRMNPEFGSGLWSLLFENYKDDFTSVIENTIKTDIQSWMPYVTVKEVKSNVNSTEKDGNYKIYVSVLFTVPSVGVNTLQTLDLAMNSTNI